MPNKNTSDDSRAARSCASKAKNTESRAKAENKTQDKSENKNNSRAKQ